MLHLEGSEKAEFRLLRGVKNRFGSTSEVGVFVMTERGMEDCVNPSALFMSPSVVEVRGDVIDLLMLTHSLSNTPTHFFSDPLF